jgi:hypothetical protein
VHLDLDVLDPEKAGKANEFAPAGGLSAEDLKMALGLIRERFAVVGETERFPETIFLLGRVLGWSHLAHPRRLVS